MYDHGCAGEYEEGLFASGFGIQREGDVYVKDEEERLPVKLSSSESVTFLRLETHAGDGGALPMSAEEEALGTISTVLDDSRQLDLNIPYESGITEDASAPAGSLGGETSITSSEITRPADVAWPCGVDNIISESSKRVQYKQLEQDEAVVLSEAQRNMDVATFDLNMSADTIPTAADNRVLTSAMIAVDSVKETPWKK